jgi:formylmethanofuran dehydrogenase subunit D
MTRTGLAPKLARHREEPLVEIHADDAVRFGLKAGDLAKVSTPQGASVFRVALSDGQRPGEIFTPIHWTDQISTGGRTGLLPRPLVDPISGQPGYKSTPAMLARVDTEWKGFLILRGETPVKVPCLWATRVAVPGGALYEIAGNGDPARIEACLPKGERVEAIDPARGTRRVAILVEGRLAGVLILTRTCSLARLADRPTGGQRCRPRRACRARAGRTGRQGRDRLRVLRHRPQPDRRGHSRAASGRCARHRQGAGRGHQLRLVPPGSCHHSQSGSDPYPRGGPRCRRMN